MNDTTLKLRNNSYNEYSCAPGDYTISLKYSATAPIRIKVEENKNYYVRFIIYSGFWSMMPELVLTDSTYAQRNIREAKLHDLNNKALWVHPKHQIGVNFGGGIGLNQVKSQIVTTDNKDTYVDFGGGACIGLKFSNQLSKHLAFDVDLDYQFSSLTPYINNAKMDFSRTRLSFTPLYIVPIGDGYLMRLKFGAGVNYCISPELNIEASNVGLFNEVWKYDNAFGFQVKAAYEMFINRNWSFQYGLSYYSTNYKFKSGGRYMPASSDFGSPKGGNLEFILGAFYSF